MFAFFLINTVPLGSIWKPLECMKEVLSNEFLRDHLSTFTDNYGMGIENTKTIVQIGMGWKLND